MGGGGNTTDGGDKDKLSTTDKTNEMISDSRKKGSDDVENLDETALTEMNSSKEGSSALTQHDSHHSDYVWLRKFNTCKSQMSTTRHGIFSVLVKRNLTTIHSCLSLSSSTLKSKPLLPL